VKNQKLIIAIVGTVVVLIGAILLLRRPPAAPPAVGPVPPRTEASKEAAPPTPAPPPEAVAPPEQAHVEAVPHEQKPLAPPSGVIRVRASQILATVNNFPIMLKDLEPLAPGDLSSEKEMESDVYQSRLNRAIEAELTFQAARSQNMSLNDEQQQRLQQIRDRAAADIAAYKSQGLQWTSIKPEQLEFEVRMISALLLQQNLVAHSSGVSSQQPEYTDALRQLLNQLRANANITINQPNS
jgi:type IV secretory pathway VirB10-like protein